MVAFITRSFQYSCPLFMTILDFDSELRRPEGISPCGWILGTLDFDPDRRPYFLLDLFSNSAESWLWAVSVVSNDGWAAPCHILSIFILTRRFASWTWSGKFEDLSWVISSWLFSLQWTLLFQARDMPGCVSDWMSWKGGAKALSYWCSRIG